MGASLVFPQGTQVREGHVAVLALVADWIGALLMAAQNVPLEGGFGPEASATDITLEWPKSKQKMSIRTGLTKQAKLFLSQLGPEVTGSTPAAENGSC